jgi:hypothetical protein
MMELTNSSIHTIVMSRVRTIHVLRSLFTSTSLSVAAVIFSLWGVGREVWVSRVFADMPSLINIGAVVHFYLAAFMNTRFIVQILIVIMLAASVWFVRNIVQMIRVTTRFA